MYIIVNYSQNFDPPDGSSATANDLKASAFVNRPREAGAANREEAKMMGITPVEFT